jgi:hypothetical protein
MIFDLLDSLDESVQRLCEWSEELPIEELHEQIVCMNPAERLKVKQAAKLIDNPAQRSRLSLAAGAACDGVTIDEFVSERQAEVEAEADVQEYPEFAEDDELELVV